MDRWKVLIIVILLIAGVLFLSIRTHVVMRKLEAHITLLLHENALLREELGLRNRWIAQRIEEVTRLNKKISSEKARHILQEVWKRAREYQLSPDLILAVIRIESSFDPKAVSDKGALGLMQVMPQYHPLPEEFDPFNIETNIAWGCAVLANYLRKNDDYRWAIRAYYAGEGGAGCREAKTYLDKVMSVLATI